MSYNIFLKNGRLDVEAGTSQQKLDEIMVGLVAEEPHHLVIHLHGGLIEREAGEAAANALDLHYRSAGAVPLFPIWETGWSEVVGQKLDEIAVDSLFNRILSRTAQFVRGKIKKELGPDASKGLDDELDLAKLELIGTAMEQAGRGQVAFPELDLKQIPIDAVSAPDAAGLDPAEQQQINREIDADDVLQQFAEEAVALQPQKRGFDLMDPAAARSMGLTISSDQSRGLVSILLLAKRIATIVARVVWRFSCRRDHGFYLTVVEEVLREFYIGPVGKFLWDGMKSAVANAFTPGSGGTALVAAIAKMWVQGVHPKITLVGHSAGAIWVARLLKELHAGLPADFTVNLVLIAPACTFTVMADALAVAGSRVAGLRVFGMGDPIESKDAIAGPIYPASLLYFVSGVLEDVADEPLVGMQRFYTGPYVDGDFAAIAKVKAFDYLSRPHAFSWSMTTGSVGWNCDMESHGGWVDAELTRLSVMSIVQQGFGYA